MIGIEHYIVVSSILFVLGVLGIFLNRKNVIVILMSIELILLAVNINFVAFSAFLNDLVGQVFAMFVLTHRERKDARMQDVSRQNQRRPWEATRNTRPEVGKGVQL